MSPVAVESSDLDWGRADRRPASAPSANAFVAARLIDEDELIGSELRDLVRVVVLEIRVLLVCYLPGRLLRPLDRLQGPAYACLRHINPELLAHKTSHLVLIHARMCEKLLAKSV
jgi:hypothetical protein